MNFVFLFGWKQLVEAYKAKAKIVVTISHCCLLIRPSHWLFSFSSYHPLISVASWKEKWSFRLETQQLNSSDDWNKTKCFIFQHSPQLKRERSFTTSEVAQSAQFRMHVRLVNSFVNISIDRRKHFSRRNRQTSFESVDGNHLKLWMLALLLIPIFWMNVSDQFHLVSDQFHLVSDHFLV